MGNAVFTERSNARRDNFIYTWADPGVPDRPESLVQLLSAAAPERHMRVLGPFDIEMPFLQYVVFCIIETGNAFSDRRVVYLFCSLSVFHYVGRCMQTVYVHT